MEIPHPQVDVLTRLMAAHQALDMGRDFGQTAAFLRLALLDVPGIAACRILLPDGSDAVPPDQTSPAPAEPHGTTASIRIGTSRAEFGEIRLTLADETVWRCYQPFVANMARMVAVMEENRRSSESLAEANDKLRSLVAELESREGERTLDRHNAHRAMAASEERFRALVEQSMAGIYAIQDDRFAYANPAFAAIFGYDSADQLIREARVADLVSPEDRERVADNIRRRLSGEVKDLHYSFTGRHRDGHPIFVEVHGHALDLDGRPAVMGLILDVTERTLAEQGLLESEARFARMFHASPVPTSITDPESGAMLDANAAWFALFGFEREEIIGRTIFALGMYGQGDQQSHIVLNLKGGQTREARELSLQHRSGRRIDVLLSADIVELGGTPQLLVLLTDITPQKDALEIVRRSQAQMRAFIEQAPIAVAMFDRKMNYLATSRRWIKDYGDGHRSLVGLNHYRAVGDMPGEWRDIHCRGLAGETIRNDEDLWFRNDGSHRWLSWVVQPWMDESGDISGIIISSEDVTLRKTAQEEIRNLNASLERRVEERTAELKAANDELDSFSYAVSHDLRAPLRAMTGFARALEEDFGESLPEAGKGFLRSIDAAGRKMGALIDGLLQLSRNSRAELERDGVDLSAMARRLQAELQREHPGRRVAWQIQDGLIARGDARMLGSVMHNLLENAWKYTAATGDPVIRVFAETLSGSRWFCVADNGAGFDMQYASQLFKPFQRLHQQNEFPGIGIGLATVQRIIRRHGGQIRAEASPGQGARFAFTLPPG